jgi:hypothetical protein
MASMEPSEDEIGQVIDFAGLDPVDDRFMVAQALKVSSSRQPSPQDIPGN